MSKFVTLAALLISLLLPSPSEAGRSAIAGHAVMSAIPVSAFVVTYFKDDVEGRKQLFRNVIANQVITSLARVGFNETDLGIRPTGNEYGFPSGHVSFAGSGASFYNERYGWKYGVPAWLATGFVMNNRVQNKDHHWRDVIASAAISYGVGMLFVTPENATYLAPVIGPGWLGLRWERSW